MKKFLRLVLATLILLGTTSTYTLAGGPEPVPDCDPFSNPHCPMPG